MVSLQAALTAMVLSASGSGETVLLDFYSDSCAPCRAMDPSVQELIQTGYPVRKVNVERNRALTAQYGVRNIPCFVMLINGREVDRVIGGTSYSRLERMCKLGLRAQAAGHSPPARAAVAATSSPPGGPPNTVPPVPIPAHQSGPPLAVGIRQTAAAEPAAPPVPASAPATQQQPPAPGWTPRGDMDAASDARLIAASVRLRIEDPQGYSCGSGTIIDARKGEALILTCGHVFRDSKGKGRIEVDLFGPGAPKRVEAQLLSYDLDRDVGLLTIRTPGPVVAARVAPPGYRVRPGDPVVSIGCNNGDRPSVRHSRVTSLNRYQGPDNLQVAGLPVEGRSGGGLFSQDGLVIGVCNAADQADQEGLFAALPVVYGQLDTSKLAFVYNPSNPSQGERPGSKSTDPPPPSALVDLSPPPMPKQMPRPATEPPQAKLSEVSLPSAPTTRWSSADNTPRLNVEEQAALDELAKRLRQGARVVCVVQPRHDPGAPNEIIILDRASVHFLKRLTGAAMALETPARETPLRPVAQTREAGGWSSQATAP